MTDPATAGATGAEAGGATGGVTGAATDAAIDAELRPSWSLSDIYPSDHVFSPRSSDRLSNWLPRDRTTMDNATGGQLPMAGDLPVVCARGVATPSGLALVREAGIPDPGPLLLYDDDDDRLARLRDLAAAGRRLIVQYLHPPDEIPFDAYWVRPELLSLLNNKANLAELVPSGTAPERRVVRTEALTERLAELAGDDLPCVLKAATDESSGGGLDVLVCRSPSDLERAPAFFAATDRVVVETWLDFRRSFCLGYVVLPDGRAIYAGAAEQKSREDGRFEGNWLKRDLGVPEAAVAAGLRTVEEAARRGYRGCVGIDAALLKSGRTVLFDLNFRMNNSTTVVLLQPSLMQHHPFEAARLVGWKCPRGFSALLREASRAMERGDLIPLGTFDPEVSGHDGLPRLRGLLLGDSEEDVMAKMERLAERGLER